MKLAKAPEKGAVSDYVEEEDAAGGGVDEVSWGGQAEEYVHQKVLRDRRKGNLPVSVLEGGDGRFKEKFPTDLALVHRAAAAHSTTA